MRLSRSTCFGVRRIALVVKRSDCDRVVDDFDQTFVAIGGHAGVVLEVALDSLALQQEAQKQDDLGDDLILSQIVSLLYEDVQRVLSRIPTVNPPYHSHE